MYFEAVVVVACLGIVVTGAPPPVTFYSSPSRLTLGLPSAKKKKKLNWNLIKKKEGKRNTEALYKKREGK